MGEAVQHGSGEPSAADPLAEQFRTAAGAGHMAPLAQRDLLRDLQLFRD